jgi:hypothetical protein
MKVETRKSRTAVVIILRRADDGMKPGPAAFLRSSFRIQAGRKLSRLRPRLRILVRIRVK